MDSRFIEGTFPLFDRSSPENTEGENDDIKDSDGSLDPPKRQNLQRQGQRIRRKTSSCFGGLFDPSLELGLHLYRMGPLNKYSTAGSAVNVDAAASRMLRSSANAGERVAALDCSQTKNGVETRSSGGRDWGLDPSPTMALWKPPSLVERGKIGLDRCGSSAVSLFARPQMAARRIGEASSGGESAGG